jgi:hypothetical protein
MHFRDPITGLGGRSPLDPCALFKTLFSLKSGALVPKGIMVEGKRAMVCDGA